MKQNMGAIDRVIRTALAVIVAILYFAGKITGLAAIILGIFAIVFLLTSIFAFCPLYTIFRMKTTKNK